jgi:hypothetical protein
MFAKKQNRQFFPSLQTLITVTTLALCFCCAAYAQIKSGTIRGKVSDQSGAVIPGASVSVISQETNVVSTTVTDPTGNFVVPYLASGTYTVSVDNSASGFAKFIAQGVTVGTAQSITLDVVLKISTTAQTVETVSATAIALQTNSSTVQSSIDQRIIEAIPNITHNAFTYAALQPGVVARGAFMDTTGTQSFGIGMDGRRQATAIQVNGGAAFSNDITLDGVSIQGSAWNESAVLPNQDSLQEVKTITNNYSAEYGRAQGVVIFTTKSGSNQLHGTAGYRIRNEALNGNSYNNKTLGITRPPFKSNTFNGSLGGPIVKDKAFFFVSYEGLRFHRGYDYLYTVPTAAERVGDFSNTMVKIGNSFQPIKIFNPYSASKLGSNNYYTRPQYASNDLRTIPGALDPYGLALLQAYPLPNRTPDDATNQNNYFRRDNQAFSKNVVNSRVDYHLGRHNLYTTFGLQQGDIATPTSWGPDVQWTSYREFVGNNQTDNNYYGALGDTFAISNSLVADIRLGMNRIQANNLAAEFPGFDYSKYGIPQYIQDINVIPGAFPQFNPGVTQTGIGGVTALGYGTSLHKKERQTNFDLNGSLTWTRGRWTHKFGATYRVMLSNYVDVDDSVQIQTSANYTRQTINADGTTTSLPSLPDNTYAGLGIASIATGAGNLRVSGGYQVRLALAQKYFALYSQNDWRVTDRLTANLGLRWDLQPGPTERYNRMSAIDLNGTEPLFHTPGAIVFPGVNGAGRNLWHTQWTNFGPRLGLAYRVTNNLVARGGFGITYIPSNTGFNDGPGFYGAAMFTPSETGQPYGTSPAGTIIGPFYSPAINPLAQPIGADVNNVGIYGGARRFPVNFRNAFVEQWNFFLEQKLGSNWIVSAGYLGSHGRNLQVDYVPINNPQLIDPAQLEAWRSAYIATGSNPATARVQNPWQPASGPLNEFYSGGTGGNLRNRTMTVIETLYPYPLEGDNVHLTTGVSDYNALQLQATRQFAHGLQLNANYTWSKQFGASRYNAETNQNYGDGNNVSAAYWPNLTPERRYLNRQLTTSDLPHRLTINGVYQLPFGRGKLINTDSKILNAIVGGWSLAGSTILQSGFIAPLTGGVTNSLNGLPDRVPGVPLEVPKSLQHWYDGKTSVTLPSGRIITPCKDCFLKYNIDAFSGRTAVQTGGARKGDTIADLYWYGNAVSSYNAIRSPRVFFTNLSLGKSVTLHDRYSLDFSAQATNVFNHTNFMPGVNMNMGATVVSSNLAPNASKNVQLGQILDVASNTFGTYKKNAYDPRQIEMSVHLRF